MPVAESSRISSESSAAILDSSEFNPTRVDSFNVSLLISFLSFRFPVHLFNQSCRRIDLSVGETTCRRNDRHSF